GVDLDGDLCVLEVDTGDVLAVEWSPEGARPAVGEPIFALSNPRGRGIRISFGIVAASDAAFRGPRGRRITDGFEHTAPLPRGSSGGPVVDSDGRLVGVNTHRLGEGIYLALPAAKSLRER